MGLEEFGITRQEMNSAIKRERLEKFASIHENIGEINKSKKELQELRENPASDLFGSVHPDPRTHILLHLGYLFEDLFDFGWQGFEEDYSPLKIADLLNEAADLIRGCTEA